MKIDTEKFCGWELRKLMKLIELAIDIDFDFQECGLNEGSGNVWLVGYEYLSCFFADIEGNVGVCATCVKCGAEKEFWLEKDTREEALEAFELAESHVCECKQGEENQ